MFGTCECCYGVGPWGCSTDHPAGVSTWSNQWSWNSNTDGYIDPPLEVIWRTPILRTLDYWELSFATVHGDPDPILESGAPNVRLWLGFVTAFGSEVITYEGAARARTNCVGPPINPDMTEASFCGPIVEINCSAFESPEIYVPELVLKMEYSGRFGDFTQAIDITVTGTLVQIPP